MPIIVACPSCGGKLRIPDALHGQKVRCPACQHIFDSDAAPGSAEAAPRVPRELPLDLNLGEPSSQQPPSSDVTPGLIGAIELERSSEKPRSSPEVAPPPEPQRRRRDRDISTLRRLGPRRDSEPDRGVVVLPLGIISLIGLMIWCVPFIGVFLVPICAILGLAAWIMGQIDLGKMKRGQMDDRNRGLTQAGWICGILGTILNGMLMLSCGLFFGFIWLSEMRRLPNTQPIPATRPMPRMGNPPRNNPPQKGF